MIDSNTTRPDKREERVTFEGCIDARGRVLGAVAYLDRCVFPAEFHVPAYRGTVWFSFRQHLTRDGAEFGPGRGAKLFRTEAERDLAVAEYFASAARRAAK